MDIYYPILPIQQPTNTSCWITSLTIIKRWKENDSDLKISEVLEVLGDPYKLFFEIDNGLPHTEIEGFFEKANMDFNEPQNYSIDGWIDLLSNKGPILVDVLSFIDSSANTIWTHAKVLVGISKNIENLYHSNFVFIDPASGEEKEETFQNFLAAYEAEPQNQIDNIQVAFSK